MHKYLIYFIDVDRRSSLMMYDAYISGETNMFSRARYRVTQIHLDLHHIMAF